MKQNRSLIMFYIYLLALTFLSSSCNRSGRPLQTANQDVAPNVSATSQTPADTTIAGIPPTQSLAFNGLSGTVSLNYNGTGTLSWVSTNATACSLKYGATLLSTDLQSAALPFGPITTSGVISLICIGSGGTATKNISVNVVPVSSVLNVSNSTIAYGATVSVTWNAQNAASCNLTDSLSLLSGISGVSGNITSPALKASDVFTLSCLGSSPVTASVNVAPSVSLTANSSPTSITVSNGSPVTLSWNSDNAGKGCVLTDGTATQPSTQNAGAFTYNANTQRGFSFQCTSAAGVTASAPSGSSLNVTPVTPAVITATMTAPTVFQNVPINPSPVPAACITLTNGGGVLASTLSANILGPNPFSVQMGLTGVCPQVCGASLAPNASCGIPVTFSPVSIGNASTTLTVSFSDGVTSQNTQSTVSGSAITGTLPVVMGNGAVMSLSGTSNYRVTVMATYFTCVDYSTQLKLDGTLVYTYPGAGSDTAGCDQNTLMTVLPGVAPGSHTWSISEPSSTFSYANYSWIAVPEPLPGSIQIGSTFPMSLTGTGTYRIFVTATYFTCTDFPAQLNLDGNTVYNYPAAGVDSNGCDQNTLTTVVSGVSAGNHNWTITEPGYTFSYGNISWIAVPEPVAANLVYDSTFTMNLPGPGTYKVFVQATYLTITDYATALNLDATTVYNYPGYGGDSDGRDQNTLMAVVPGVAAGAHTFSIKKSAGDISNQNITWFAVKE